MPAGLFSEAYSAMEHVESTMQNQPALQPAPKTSPSPKIDATEGPGDAQAKKKRGFGTKLMGLVHIGAAGAAAAPEAARPGQLALAAECHDTRTLQTPQKRRRSCGAAVS